MDCEGESFADLAGKLEIKPADLETTVAKYNEYCKNRIDPDFERPGRSLVPLQKPPF
jgi:hypothetical protein